MNLRQFDFALLGLPGGLGLDLDKVGAGNGGSASYFAGVHAAGGDKIGLGLLVGGKYVQDGNEVLIGQVAGFAADKAADETAGYAGFAGDVTLVELPMLGVTLECDAEIAHRLAYVDGRWFIVCSRSELAGLFVAACVALYATALIAQLRSGTGGTHGKNEGDVLRRSGLYIFWELYRLPGAGCRMFAILNRKSAQRALLIVGRGAFQSWGGCWEGFGPQNCQQVSGVNLVWVDCRESVERARCCALVRVAIWRGAGELKNMMYKCHASAEKRRRREQSV